MGYYKDTSKQFHSHIRPFNERYNKLSRKLGIPSIGIYIVRDSTHLWERAVSRDIPRYDILKLCKLLFENHYCELLYLCETNSNEYVMVDKITLRVDYKNFLVYFLINKVQTGKHYKLTMTTCMPKSFRKEDEIRATYCFDLGENKICQM